MDHKSNRSSCADCYFRREGLCAIPGDRPCPTFRAATTKGLVPPRQAQLLRPLALAAAT
jgi:hypothetical protein